MRIEDVLYFLLKMGIFHFHYYFDLPECSGVYIVESDFQPHLNQLNLAMVYRETSAQHVVIGKRNLLFHDIIFSFHDRHFMKLQWCTLLTSSNIPTGASTVR